MNINDFRTGLVLVTFLALAACDQPGTVTERPLAVNAQTTDARSFPTALPASVHASMDADERRDLILRNLDVFHGEDRDWGRLLISDASLVEKDQLIGTFLEEHPGPEWTVVRQLTASTMLAAHLKAVSPDPDAVSQYTRVLVESESPDADLIARALPLLRDRWSEAEVTAAATATQDAAVDWIARTCSGCAAGEAIGTGTGPEVSDLHATTQRALPALARLATY